MDRYAIFVDAGYFFAAGAQAVFGNHTLRKQIALKSSAAMLADLCGKAAAAADNLQLLRIYWYDAMPGPRLSLDQTGLAMLRGVKLRLGALSNAGEQKGVDSLIVTDLIDLARNRAIADAVVVAGDEDLRIAFQVAQSFGVRVHILAVGDPSKNVSKALQMEADSVTVLDAAWLVNYLECLPATPAPEFTVAETRVSAALLSAPMARMTASDEIDRAADGVIQEILGSITPEKLEQLVQHLAALNTVPPEYDRPLKKKVSIALSDRRFSSAESHHIRQLFVRAARNRSGLDEAG
ncbi:MAG: NYN domain-containing protein [Candidatus Accumulibacter sp.]|jgi:uncharacterized LabA/DUF88 family protein|nr:NYN domain-containing protein [Accumulibacter sp.]